MRTISEIMHDISGADVVGGVYRVSLVRAGHMAGFEAIIEMRGDVIDGYSAVSHRGETAELALVGAEESLLGMYGRCPICGQHRNMGPNRHTG